MQIYPFRVPRRCISCNSFAVTEYADRANVRGSLGRITNERMNERTPPWGETRALIHEIYLSKVCSLKARGIRVRIHIHEKNIHVFCTIYLYTDIPDSKLFQCFVSLLFFSLDTSYGTTLRAYLP